MGMDSDPIGAVTGHSEHTGAPAVRADGPTCRNSVEFKFNVSKRVASINVRGTECGPENVEIVAYHWGYHD